MKFLKIRRDKAKSGDTYRQQLMERGFKPVRFGVPSPVGRVVKGTLVATTLAGKRAWWLLGRLYAKREK